MKLTIILLFFVVILSCKEKPTYNPFDDQYNVAVSELVKDNCDTLSAGCGYFNLIQRSGRFKTYYQTFMEKPNHVVAKGFSYVIDSFETQKDISLRINDSFTDSILDLPINQQALDNELKKFDYKIYKRAFDNVFIINDKINDTIRVSIIVGADDINKNRIYRVINYYDSPEYGKANK